MKRLLSLLLACMMMFSFVAFAACQDNNTEDKQLAIPQNVAVDKNGVVSWNAVANAQGYVLVLNGQRQQNTVTATTYQLATLNKDVTIAVIAVADGYKESAASAEVKYTASTGPIVKPTKVAVSGSSEVRAGKTTKLDAYVEGSTQGVTFSVESGAEYVSVDQTGLVSAKIDVSGDKTAVIKVTSIEDPSLSTTKVLNVLARTVLTQEMLNRFNGKSKIGFDGFLTINYYTYGEPRRHAGTTTMSLHTSLDGEHWYAEYENGSAGITGELFYSKYHDASDGIDYAYQDSLSFLNVAEQTPLVDRSNNRTTWEDAGLYNNLDGLKLSDFAFDEDLWRWKYVGTNQKITARIVASADPYNFAAEDGLPFSLLVDDGEIVGLYIKGNDDHTVSTNYIAVQEVFVAVNTDDTVTVPSIRTFEHKSFHDELAAAINNMHNLKAYTLDFLQAAQMNGSSSTQLTGFYEIINDTDCFFRDYVPETDDSGNIVRNTEETAVYGFRKINDNLYNTYNYRADSIYDIDPDKFDAIDTSTRSLRADRAYMGSFDKAKPTFGFAAELFTVCEEVTEENADTHEETTFKRYFVDESMTSVASTLYFGIGNDIALYGMFASTGVFGNYKPTYVEVKYIGGKPYITGAGFYYYLGSVYGIVQLTYDNFVEEGGALTEETTVPEQQAARIAAIPARSIPADWSQVNVICKRKDSITQKETDYPTRAKQYFESIATGLSDKVPFFGSEDCIGDTFGFALDTVAKRGGMNYMTKCVSIYYDVPLDVNYTIDSSLTKIKAFLAKKGFTTNTYGEYVSTDGKVVIKVTDEGMDLIIYVWYIGE